MTEVAARAGVSRQSVHAWIRRYEQGGLGGAGGPVPAAGVVSASGQRRGRGGGVRDAPGASEVGAGAAGARAGQGRGGPGAVADERLPGPGPARADRAEPAQAAEGQLPAVGTR